MRNEKLLARERFYVRGIPYEADSPLKSCPWVGGGEEPEVSTDNRRGVDDEIWRTEPPSLKIKVKFRAN